MPKQPPLVLPVKIDHIPDVSGIYEITNLRDGKSYIGSSLKMKSRIKSHIKGLIAGHHFNDHLQNAWNEYEEKRFVCQVLEIVEDDSILPTREAYWIELFDSSDCGSGYNKRYPEMKGDGTRWILSDKSIEKLRARLKIVMPEVNSRPGFQERRGKAISAGLQTAESKVKRSAIFKAVMNKPEVKQKLREATLRLQQDPEWRKKNSAGLVAANKKPEVKERRRQAQLNKKEPTSQETRAKMAEGIKKKWADPEWREKMLAARKKVTDDPAFGIKIEVGRILAKQKREQERRTADE